MIENKEIIQLAEKFCNSIPFNLHIGLHFSRLDVEACEVNFDFKPELVGNFVQGILHGGVISSAMDVAGGAMAAMGVLQRNQNASLEELQERFAKLGTIDLRVDFLRPGRGKSFVASATVLRSGNKVSVTRMELHNEENVLIAVGTGTYLVG
ncbi:thioesterase family protein [Pleionea sp. CnH1-48]|uniref:thioesterase family protein n=1 Tax=Pleionea sp. CnH1-48 TaxID=2954494 RepID=UPI002097A939|nr:thioesterase family protein [Pleionea sp. CnH1-48]MCO7226299.1 thioesterase family protein [Pleionea sp. CnH1-48]